MLTKLILDCGAISHMFCNKSFFVSYLSVTLNEMVSIGDVCNIPVSGFGSVCFRSILPGSFQTVTLHGALDIPKLTANLVSLSKLQ